MSIFARFKFNEQGRMTMPAVEEDEKTAKAALAAFAQERKGQYFYMEVFSEEELNFQGNNLVNYYRKIVMPALYLKMKEPYNLDNMNECDALLHVMFSKVQKTRKTPEGETANYTIIIPIDKMQFKEQGLFLSKVAALAIKDYSLRFPSANEINERK